MKIYRIIFIKVHSPQTLCHKKKFANDFATECLPRGGEYSDILYILLGSDKFWRFKILKDF